MQLRKEQPRFFKSGESQNDYRISKVTGSYDPLCAWKVFG
jgi:hypothetical protein